MTLCQEELKYQLIFWQNGRLFADDIFKCISMKQMFAFKFKLHWNVLLQVQIAWKFICNDLVFDKPTLLKYML